MNPLFVASICCLMLLSRFKKRPFVMYDLEAIPLKPYILPTIHFILYIFIIESSTDHVAKPANRVWIISVRPICI
jgi:hypothetical protein